MGKYDGRSRDQKQGTAQIAAKLSFKGFWVVLHALKVVFSDCPF